VPVSLKQHAGNTEEWEPTIT